MNLLPQTAFARIALLIALVLCITTVVAGLVFGRFAQQQWVERFAGRIVREVERVNSTAQLQGWDAVSGRAGSRAGVTVARRPPDLHRRGRLAGTLEILLGQELGTVVRVRLSHDQRPVVWVNTDAQPDYWVGVPFGRGWVGPAGRLLLWLAAVGLVVFVGAYFLARQFTRPLEALVQVTGAIGRGDMPPAVDESGPREVRELRRALYRAASDQREVARIREEMLAGVSHDLRTPMSRLRIAGEMMVDSPEDRSLLDGMMKDIEEMDRIIEQFLAWVRNGQDETAEQVVFDELVADCVQRFVATGQAVEFEPGAVGLFWVRPLAMRRLISNLLSNAAVHGKGPVSVHTELAAGRLMLVVGDRGEGIPADRQNELLRPFATRSGSRGEAGAGLGLAIVDRVARLHGGKIRFARRDGVFEVRIDFFGGLALEGSTESFSFSTARP